MTIVDRCELSVPGPELLRVRGSAYRFDPHLHDTCSVVLVMAGRVSLESPRWRGVAHAGDVFLFNPFEVHAGGSDQRIEYQALYPSARLLADCVLRAASRSVTPRLRTKIVRRSTVTQTLLEILQAPMCSHAKLEAALCGVLHACALETATAPTRAFMAVQAACEAIRNMPMHMIDTDALARYARLNKSHFIRMFHRVTGLAPQTYARQVRLARAHELICRGAELVDVAQATGFCDQPHMTREFKKVYGMTPGRLSRDLLRGKSPVSATFRR
jgi:AraC-like DNA-binding protein